MLDPAAIAALLTARHPDPFALLGLHADAQGRWWLRVLWPGAQAIEVLDASGQHRQSLHKIHPDGLFEAEIQDCHERIDYRLRLHWADGSHSVHADAFAYGSLFEPDQLRALQAGRFARPHQLLGAHPLQVGNVNGVRFAVWAPNASRVSVVGDFNQWDGRRHPLRLHHELGVWEIFVPEVGLGALYKFELLDAAGRLLPLKADPYARQAQLRPDTASCVAAPSAIRTLPQNRAAANARTAPISIYEVHASSWRLRDDGSFPSWDELAEALPAYAAAAGFSHIELLPISEHPFDGSWGYQALGLFAPTARFGPPAGFARFVESCHALGLGVLLDWVPAHFPSDAHGLALFDGTALYEYADPREGFHRDWNTLIYNYGRDEVRAFLCASALYWIESWAVDGLRVDAVASMLYRDYSREAGQWLPNRHGGRENLEAISLFQAINQQLGALAPGAITVAEESTAFPQVSAPTDVGGLGFHYKWNMGWMNDTLRYIQQDPVHRRWHHDQLTFGLVYAFSENFVLPISHDEVVHGKGSMLAKMPGDEWQKFANLRAYYGFMWGHPGKKLLFMGQEFGQREEWDHQQSLPWAQLQQPAHSGVLRLITDLNRLYRGCPALHRLDCEAAGFQWLVADDREQSVLAWARFDGQGGVALVICNFTPVPRPDYRLPLPDSSPAAWREVLNTDSAHYGGSNLGNGGHTLQAESRPAHGRSHSLQLSLPPLATIFLLPA